MRRGSTSFSVSGSIAGVTAKALPLNLTFVPYGFCLISRFPFINSLREPLAALFHKVR